MHIDIHQQFQLIFTWKMTIQILWLPVASILFLHLQRQDVEKRDKTYRVIQE